MNPEEFYSMVDNILSDTKSKCDAIMASDLHLSVKEMLILQLRAGFNDKFEEIESAIFSQKLLSLKR
jgi:hypothetical protein